MGNGPVVWNRRYASTALKRLMLLDLWIGGQIYRSNCLPAQGGDRFGISAVA
jgi:hypothetical protein